MEGGPGQPTAPGVPAAAMKSNLPEVRRQEEGKGGGGQPAARAAGSGDSSVRTGRRGRKGNRGKGQAGTSGARHAKYTSKGKGEKGGDRGDSGRSPNTRSGCRRRGRPRRSVRRCGRRRRGRRAASWRHDTRRWRTWSASTVATSPRSRDRTPSTVWRWSQGGRGRGARGGARGREGSTAGSPVAGCGEREGRQNRAAHRWRGTAASGRESKNVEASEMDTQAARCRAGVRDK